MASFDGGSSYQRKQGSVMETTRADGGSHVTFDSTEAASRALQAARAEVKFPQALDKLHNLHTDLAGWPILSIGSTPSGLPPHVHGSSYLLLLQGTKSWAMWSPALGLPEAAREVLPSTSLRTNATEMLTALQLLEGAAKPLLCDQHPGDVVFLPPGAF